MNHDVIATIEPLLLLPLLCLPKAPTMIMIMLLAIGHCLKVVVQHL